MRYPITVLVRIFAIVGKELIETFRRPGAIVSLILGPFLIMAVFGLGYSGVRRPLEAIIVASANTQLPTDTATYQDLAGPAMHIREVTQDEAAAESALHAGQVDVVIIAPDNALATFKAGKQSEIKVLVDEIDPVKENYAQILGSTLASAVNRKVIEQAVAEGQGVAIDAGNPDVQLIPPEVVAAPTTSFLQNLAPSRPAVLSFFGPAVLALILQHLAVTLVALSLVRERKSGVMELFRISPVSAWEILAGKIIAYGVLGAGIAIATVALLVAGFGIPVLADPAYIAAVIGIFLLASLGVGLLVAMLSDSERQAVQLSLLVLLSAVFFSGFVLSIDEFSPLVRGLAYLLPVTHAITLLQDLMLRGSTNSTWEIGALAAIAAATILAAWLLLRRELRTA